MVAKKRGLYLGLLVSLLGIGNVIQTYKITIKNKTPFKIRYSIGYASTDKQLECRNKNDRGEIVSGMNRDVNTGTCSTGPVRIEIKSSNKIWKEVIFEAYSTSEVVGDAMWIIEGPLKSKKSRYTITKKSIKKKN